MAKSFDRGMHQPFRLDHKGFNKEMTLKDAGKGTITHGEETKIPNWW